MHSNFTAHFPADAIPRGDDASGRAEKPVVLVSFAQLVLLVGALLIFTPLWLDTLRELADGPPPHPWGELRLLAMAGSGGFVALCVLVLKVWTGLLKHLARAD